MGRSRPRRRAVLAAGAVAVLLATCGGDPAQGSPPTSDAEAGVDSGDEASAGMPACSGPFLGSDDGHIAALLDAVDAAEVSLEPTVRDRLNSPSAIAFAEKMITDHTLLDLQLRGAVRTDHLSLLPGTASEAIASQAAEAAQALGPLQGAALDRAYVGHELLVHVQELALLDRMAVPAVKDVRLAAAVGAARDLAAQHATLAAQIASQLDSGP